MSPSSEDGDGRLAIGLDFMKVMADLDYGSFSAILSKKAWFHWIQENMGSEKLEMRSENSSLFFFFWKVKQKSDVEIRHIYDERIFLSYQSVSMYGRA